MYKGNRQVYMHLGSLELPGNNTEGFFEHLDSSGGTQFFTVLPRNTLYFTLFAWCSSL